jgi:purine-binding chemotaxis protein CheW
MDTAAATELRGGSASTTEGKYLTFTLADEEYGIGILKVKEIIGMIAITTVPQTPPHIKGVINLRGKVIPVIDLRLKFDLPDMEYTERTCIIVIEIAKENGNILIGILVDSVSEVLNIKGADIRRAPQFWNPPQYGLHTGNGQNRRQDQNSARHRPCHERGRYHRPGIKRIVVHNCGQGYLLWDKVQLH